MVSLCCYKWTWIPLIVLSLLIITKSEKPRERISPLSRRNQQRHLISNENHQDLASNDSLTRKNRSSRTFGETNMMTMKTLPFDNKKTLLDLEKPALFKDFQKPSDLEESGNDTYIRVKRIEPNFNASVNLESLYHFDNNYLEDLVDSFPRSSKEQRWTFKKRHIGLSNNKISNTSNYGDLFLNSNLTFTKSNTNDSSYYFNKNITDSMISNIYKKDDEERVHTNFSRISDPIDSTPNINGPYKIRIKRERKPAKNIKHKVLHGKKRKLKKHAGKKEKKKGISSKRAGKRISSNSYKMASSSKGKRRDHLHKNNSPNLIDDYQVDSEVKKRDFNSGGLDVNADSDKKEFLHERARKDEGAAVDEALRDKRSLNANSVVSKKGETSPSVSHVDTKREKFRTKRNENNDLTLLKYSNESTLSSLSISPENEIQISAEKPRDERAVKSIEEIKELAEKLVTKVNELQNYMSYENQRENRQGSKRKLESREIEIPRVNATPFEEEVVLEAPKLVDECVRIGDLSSALKTLNDGRNVSLESNTSSIEVATEGINLLNDRSGPLSKRMARKSRIKRKSRRKWGRWTGWSSCSVTCGKGRQIRWRHCLRDCSTVETEMEEKSCQLPACPPGKFLGIF